MEMVNMVKFKYFCFINIFLVEEICESSGKHQKEIQRYDKEHYERHVAHFDYQQPQNVSAIVGKTAFLTCVVKNLLPTQKVSFVRHRDVHILTSGEQTFTSDQRFSARHNTEDEWVLLVKYVQERDAGIYECQIPTKPAQSYPITLNIIVPRVRIQGSPDLHVNRGSTINLTCIISDTPEPPAYIFWYFNDEVMAYESPRGSITIVTETGQITQSHLVIWNARQSDEGNYTCKPSIFKSATLRLFVLNGDFPAAMHTSSTVQVSFNLNHLFSLGLLLFLI